MRNLSADNTAATSATVTSPHWFVKLGFGTELRLTTASTVAWASGGGTYTKTDIDVRLSESPSIRIFNELASLGVTVLSEGVSGKSVEIWQAYTYAAASPTTLAGYAEPVLVFSGEMESASIGDYVDIQCVRTRPQFTPRTYVTAPTFNYTPKAGTIIEMPNQKITLE